MPYIITTKPRPRLKWHGSCVPGVESRRAVATLEEAQDAVPEMMHGRHNLDVAAIASTAHALISLPDSGGTIGPLPDGTEIEVSPATWHDLIDAIGGGIPQLPETPEERAEIIDAYNAVQS